MYSIIFKLCNVICILYIIEKLNKLFLWYFVVCVFWILLSSPQFSIKQFIFLPQVIVWWLFWFFKFHSTVSLWICQWTNFVNRSLCAKVMTKNQSGCFFIETLCSFDTHKWILIIFGISVTKIVSNQNMFYFSPQLSRLRQSSNKFLGHSVVSVSYTHLTLPTNREV